VASTDNADNPQVGSRLVGINKNSSLFLEFLLVTFKTVNVRCIHYALINWFQRSIMLLEK